MRITALLLTTTLATNVASIVIPRHIPDGDYLVSQLPDGSHVFIGRKTANSFWRSWPVYPNHPTSDIVKEDIAPVNHFTKRPGPALEARPYQIGTGCFATKRGFKSADYHRAKKNFNNFCAMHPHSPFQATVSVSGNSAVYACRRHSEPRSCDRNQLAFAESVINEKCGKLGPGFVYLTNLDLEYGRTHRGANICEGPKVLIKSKGSKRDAAVKFFERLLKGTRARPEERGQPVRGIKAVFRVKQTQQTQKPMHGAKVKQGEKARKLVLRKPLGFRGRYPWQRALIRVA